MPLEFRFLPTGLGSHEGPWWQRSQPELSLKSCGIGSVATRGPRAVELVKGPLGTF